MNSSELVSVVTPFYNPRPSFLEESIESVLAQTYSHWELLLVDDGSTAPSAELAKSYAARHPGSVTVLQHEGGRNLGHSESRNVAIRAARGEYIALLDADDVWRPRKLEEQVELIRRHPAAGMVYGRTLYWYSWIADPRERASEFTPALGVEPGILIKPPQLLARTVRGDASVPCTCSVLIRRSLIERVGAFEPTFTGLYGDQAFYAKLCLAAPVVAADSCWDWYRQHPASLCTSTSPADRAAARRRYLMWLEKYLVQHVGDDGSVQAAVARGLWELEHPARARALRTGRRLSRLAGRLLPGWARGAFAEYP